MRSLVKRGSLRSLRYSQSSLGEGHRPSFALNQLTTPDSYSNININFVNLKEFHESSRHAGPDTCPERNRRGSLLLGLTALSLAVVSSIFSSNADESNVSKNSTTKISDAELEKLLSKLDPQTKLVFLKIKEYEENLSGWALNYKVNNIVGVIKPVAFSPIVLMRSFTYMFYEPQVLIDGLQKMTKEEWAKFDPNIVEFEILKVVDENTRISRHVRKFARPEWPREFVLKETRIKDGDKYYWIYRSLSDDEMKEIGVVIDITKNIPAKVALGAYIFSPKVEEGNPKTKSKCTTICHVDPQGDTAPMIVNISQDYHYEFARNLEKALGLESPPKPSVIKEMFSVSKRKGILLE